jgi:glycosyltransferase involved in cell wall biosynthesis
MKNRVWLDVSDLLVWEGHATGIPRTLECIAQIWLRRGEGRVAFCVLNEDKDAFGELTGAEFERRWEEKRIFFRERDRERAAALLKEASLADEPTPLIDEAEEEAQGPLKRFAGAFPLEIEPRVYDLTGTSLHWVLSCVRFLQSLVMYFVRGAANVYLRLANKEPWLSPEQKHILQIAEDKRLKEEEALRRNPPLPPAAFAEGDVLFSAGGGWMREGYTELLAALKASHGLRCATLIYDVIPHSHPHFFWEGFPPIFTEWLKASVPLSDLIFTISESSRRDILRFQSDAGESLVPTVKVIRLGDSLLHEIHEPAVPTTKIDLTSRQFVLTVGTLEVRKNHALLYRVWRRLCAQTDRTPPVLVLVGRRGWLTADLVYQMQHDPLTRDHVLVLDSIDDRGLAWLYKHCSFTVYPSLYEGWGLPVAESLVCGKFCIASNAASLPEIPTHEGLVDFHDPHEAEACAALIEHALQNPEYVQAKEKLIREHYRPTRWEDAAMRMLDELYALSTSPQAKLTTAPQRVAMIP